MENDSVFMGRRDLGPKEKRGVARAEFVETVGDLLSEFQDGLLARARAFRDEATAHINSKEEFEAFFAEGKPGGFAWCFAADDPSYEPLLKSLKVTARCIPLADNDERGTCIFTGAEGQPKIVFAKSY